MSMSEFMTGTQSQGNSRGVYSYTADTSMPWGMVPGGRELSTAGKVIGGGFKAAMGASAGQTVAKVAAFTAARVGASSIAAGATAGSVVPGVGTAIGAVAGAIAPFVLPHIPVVGAAVNKIPLVGGMLSPKKGKSGKQTVVMGQGPAQGSPHLAQASASHLAQAPASHLAAAPLSPLSSHRYVSGRGFRR